MGNSPSQEKSEGAEGEPDNFDLDAISEDSSPGEEKKEKTGPFTGTMPNANVDQLRRSGGSQRGSDPHAHPLSNQELAATQDRHLANAIGKKNNHTEAASTPAYQNPPSAGELGSENNLETLDGRQAGSQDLSGKFECKICACTFKRQGRLRRHYKSSHKREEPFKCEDCGKIFPEKDDLQQHVQGHCGGANEIKQERDAGAMDGAAKEEISETSQRNASVESNKGIHGQSFSRHQASKVHLNSYPAVEDTKMAGVESSSSDHGSIAQEEVFGIPKSGSPSAGKVHQPSGVKRKRDTSSVADASSPRPESKKQRDGVHSPPTSLDFAGNPRSKTKEAPPKTPVGTSDCRGLQRLKEDTQSVTLVTSSGAQAPKLPLRSELSDVDDSRLHQGMATSTGRRVFPGRAGRWKKSPDIVVDESDSASEYDDRAKESDEMSSPAPLPQKIRTSLGLTRPSKAALKSPRIKKPNTVEARRSGEEAIFKHNLSNERARQNPQRDSKSRVTGRFTVEESSKLEEYRDSFCAEHDIEEARFNDMMTLAGRKGGHGVWPYAFMSKREFLDQYYNVLPDRNRKSMARYRERNFQNAEGSRHWTQQDDEDIVRLVNKIGPKWVEIGQRLTRTQDAVQQRWKNKLQHRDKIRIGEWTDEEVTTLRANVERAKNRGGLSQDASSDHRISWSKISDRMGNTRTAQQCAGKWFLLQGGPYTPAKPNLTTPKSRSVGLSSKKTRRKPKISDEFIKDSAEDTNSDKNQEINREVVNKPEIQETASGTGRERRSNGHISERENEDPESSSSVMTGKRKKRSTIGLDTSSALDEINTPGMSKVRLSKTPATLTSLSQAFASTQVNSSAVRGSSKKKLAAWSQISDRPSPNIGMRLRPGHQPELGEHEARDVHQDDEEDQQSQTDDQALPGLAETIPTVRQEEEEPRSDGKETEVDEESDGDEESESDHDRVETRRISGKTEKDPAVSKIDRNPADGQKAHVETRSESEGDSVRDKNEGEESSSEYEESAETEGDDSDEDDDQDSMVDAVQNDFMASVKETAKKNQLARQRRMTAPSEESTSESGSDTDSDDDGDEEIEHGLERR